MRLAAAILLAATASCASPANENARQPPATEQAPRGDTPLAEPRAGAPPGVRARVTRVVDGDTFEAAVRGDILDVRLIGIDAPETVHPTEAVECFGPEASDFTERRLERARVVLEFDVERIDPFGRTLAYVWIGRRLFNEDIVRMGYATLSTFPPNVAHVERLVEAERKARRDGLGLWDACLDPIDTGKEWRELHGDG